jgi:hypothetical protein
MSTPRTAVWFSVGGLIVGILLAAGAGRVAAGGGDRPDAASLVIGPIATEFNRQKEIQVTKDGVFYLNYSKGRLLAAVPFQRQTAGAKQVLSEFAERDLVADFQLKPGTQPHFLMSTGTLGAYDGEGAGVLYVFESTTGQLAIYRVVPEARAGSTRPAFQLLERKSDSRFAHAGPVLARSQ